MAEALTVARRFRPAFVLALTTFVLGTAAESGFSQTNLCKAILARKSVKLSGDMLVDSFNSLDPFHSTNGRYDATKREDGADIASVSDTVTVITDTGNTRVYGHLATGPSGSVSISGNASAGSIAWVDGGNRGIQPGWYSTNFQATIPEVSLPNISFSTLKQTPGTVNGTNYTHVLTNGNYRSTSSFTLNSSSSMCINGNVVLYFQNGFQVSGQAFIYIAPNAKLTVYLGAGSSISGRGTINGTGNATNCTFYGLPGCTSLQNGGVSDFIGSIYAPEAALTLAGGGSQVVNFAGSVVAHTVTISGSYQFHYDQALCGGCSKPVIVTPPVSQTVCPGDTANFNVAANGIALTYQWFGNGGLLAGRTSTLLTLTNVSAADAGTYSIVVSGPCGSVTNSASLTVNQQPVVITPPTSLTNCPGTTATFNVSAIGTALSYQWYKGGSPLTGRTSNSLSLTNVGAADAGIYAVVVNGACGSSVSNIASLTVTPLPIISCVSNKTVQLGTPWNFDAPTANYPIIVLGTMTNTAGHCGNTFDATRTWAAIDACNNSAQCSQAVTVVDTTPPIITCSNTNKTVELGTAWMFDPPTSTDNSGTNITIMVVSTVTNTTGHCGNTFDATRTWAAIDACNNSAQCSQTVTVVDTTPPIINCSNTNKTVELGSPWTFDPPTATDNSGTNITIMIVSTVTNTAGHCGNTFDATRTWAAIDACNNSAQCSQTVTVVDTTPPIITCSNTNKTVELGTPWTFDPPTATDNSGTNITIMVVSTVTNTVGHCGGSFDATRTWAAIDGCNNSAQCSQKVIVVDTNPIVLITPPSNQTNCFATIANFNIVAQGTGLTYIWLYNSSIVGTNNTLSLDTSVAGQGQYTVVVTDQCNDTITNSAVLVINAATVATPLSDAIKNLGDSITFVTTASGTGPFTYIWKKNGSVISSATTSSLALTNLTFADDADYAVEVTGSCNTAVQAAHLTINHPPTVSIISPTNGSVFIAPATFTLAANAQDVDGTVTNIAFYQAVTNKLGETTNSSPGLIFLTNQPIGPFTFTAIAADDLGARGTSAPVSISVIAEPPLVLVSSIRLNPQTGLFEQNVRVLNPTYNSFYAVRVTIGNLTNGTVVYNPSGFTNGIAYVQSHAAVPAGAFVDFVIEYYIPSRIIPDPSLHAQLVPADAGGGTVAFGYPQHIDRGLWLPDKTFLVEFLTVTNRVYSIQYTTNLMNWRNAQPAVVGNGTRIQWIDNGQPKTETPPESQMSRFYRVVLLP